MTKWTLTAALMLGLGFFAAASNAADDAKKDADASGKNADGKSFTGILVDNKCGDKLTTLKFAQRHPQNCLKMEDCAKTGFQVIVGDKHLKFDEKGNTLAKEFIASDDFTSRVMVMGTPGADGKTLNVTSIKSVPEEKKEDDKTAKADGDEKAEKATKEEKGEKKSEKKSEKSEKSESSKTVEKKASKSDEK
jgi:hypothetical protein